MTKYCRDDHTPEWFDLKNYEPLKDMGREDIYKLVMIRETVYNSKLLMGCEDNLIDSLAISKINAFPTEGGSITNLNLLQLMRLCLVNAGNRPAGNTHKDDFIDFLTILSEELSNTDDAARRPLATDEMMKNYERKQQTALGASNIVIIDTTKSDERILRDVKDWLKSKREPWAKDNKQVTDSEKNKIITNQLIPCMDLLIWGRAKGIHYTDAQLGDILFPFAGLDRAEKVRKKTRKDAIEYLTTDAFNRIL